jgi:hypothetical protein
MTQNIDLARVVLDLLQRGFAFCVTSELDAVDLDPPQQRGGLELEAPRWIRAMDNTEDVELQEAWECFGSEEPDDHDDPNA